MKYNYYVYIPRIGCPICMLITVIGLWNHGNWNLGYLLLCVIIAQSLYTYERRLLKRYEPQYQKISFKDSLLMYPILLKIEIVTFLLLYILSILFLLCIQNYYFIGFTTIAALICISIFLKQKA